MIRKLERHIRSNILKPILAGRFNENESFVISSTPRSGSTLLGQVLSAIPNSCTLFEPLHLKNVPEAAAAGFGWRTYLRSDDNWPEGKSYLKRVFRGEILNQWTIREISYRDVSKKNLLIVKFVRANRLYPWLCANFDLPPPILLIRHPCGVISSQLNYGWKGKERPDLTAYLQEFPRFRDTLERIQPGVEHLAAKWALDHIPALLEPKPHPWIIITYEELLLRPEETLVRIMERWQVEIDIEEALLKLKIPSSVVTGFKANISGVNGWKKNLSANQITSILDTTRAFGLSFYSEEIEADYDQLHSNDLSDNIRSAGRKSFDR